MGRYQLTCQYCGLVWNLSYLPKEEVSCSKCRDTHIRAIDISSQIDYYAGSPPFEKEDPDWNV